MRALTGLALVAGGLLLITSKKAKAKPVPGSIVLHSEGVPAIVLELAQSNLGQTDGDAYLTELGLDAGLNWCAAALTSWIKDASHHEGVAPPIAGSGLSKDLMYQFQAAGRWFPKELISPSDVEPGMVAVWHRGEVGALTGHAGVVLRVVNESMFETIDANSVGGAVYQNTRRFDDPKLLGFGYLGEM